MLGWVQGEMGMESTFDILKRSLYFTLGLYLLGAFAVAFALPNPTPVLKNIAYPAYAIAPSFGLLGLVLAYICLEAAFVTHYVWRKTFAHALACLALLLFVAVFLLPSGGGLFVGALGPFASLLGAGILILAAFVRFSSRQEMVRDIPESIGRARFALDRQRARVQRRSSTQKTAGTTQDPLSFLTTEFAKPFIQDFEAQQQEEHDDRTLLESHLARTPEPPRPPVLSSLEAFGITPITPVEDYDYESDDKVQLLDENLEHDNRVQPVLSGSGAYQTGELDSEDQRVPRRIGPVGVPKPQQPVSREARERYEAMEYLRQSRKLPPHFANYYVYPQAVASNYVGPKPSKRPESLGSSALSREDRWIDGAQRLKDDQDKQLLNKVMADKLAQYATVDEEDRARAEEAEWGDGEDTQKEATQVLDRRTKAQDAPEASEPKAPSIGTASSFGIKTDDSYKPLVIDPDAEDAPYSIEIAEISFGNSNEGRSEVPEYEIDASGMHSIKLQNDQGDDIVELVPEDGDDADDDMWDPKEEEPTYVSAHSIGPHRPSVRPVRDEAEDFDMTTDNRDSYSLDDEDDEIPTYDSNEPSPIEDWLLNTDDMDLDEESEPGQDFEPEVPADRDHVRVIEDVNPLDELVDPLDTDRAEDTTVIKPELLPSATASTAASTAVSLEQHAKGTIKPAKKNSYRRYKVDLFDYLEDKEVDNYWDIGPETEKQGNNLLNVLDEFGCPAEIKRIKKGPVVTMFELAQTGSYKISKVGNIYDDIKLRLGATTLRIISPIPGKKVFGIEVNSPTRAMVRFREFADELKKQTKKSELPVVLGTDVEGEHRFMDIADAPHMLVAGATGSGKSVFINAMLVSLLATRKPTELRLVLVDPKRVELGFYDDIPHLLTPVINEPKKCIKLLEWALYEMERRLKFLKRVGSRDIKSYNERINAKKLDGEILPRIVIVIDEFADFIVSEYGKNLEAYVQRLTAVARAAGIHVVLATQRPSVKVVPGVIKANLPTRVGFQTSSGTDSQVILDQVGAEMLLGRGDMLYLARSTPVLSRIQGVFLEEEEVHEIVAYIKTLGSPDYLDSSIFEDEESTTSGSSGSRGGPEDDLNDPLFVEAIKLARDNDGLSTSALQRYLRVGYNKAARFVELLESLGVLGPPNGSKPRDFLTIPVEYVDSIKRLDEYGHL